MKNLSIACTIKSFETSICGNVTSIEAIDYRGIGCTDKYYFFCISPSKEEITKLMMQRKVNLIYHVTARGKKSIDMVF